MIIPIRCPSCGRPIAHLYEAFKKKIEAGEDSKKILDELGIKSYCCRSLFLTHVDQLKQLAKFKR